jgi:GrpB-like predicted nucleotidyltransferase (UPF0157 family)
MKGLESERSVPRSQTPGITIGEYDPQWPVAFAAVRHVLAKALGTLALAIEHVGSTAIPGLAAKPILDLDVVIACREYLPDVIEALSLLGYFHQGDLGIVGREAFGRRSPDVPRDGTGRAWPAHHLYVCAHDSAELARHITFRDYLRKHPEAVEAYAKLKRRLAERFAHDHEEYAQHKTGFVEDVLRRADGSDSSSQRT